MADTGIVNIHGKAYETVALRVQKFRETHPDYTLETVIVDRTDQEVVMRALISDKDGRLIATGYAEEKRSASTINKTSALENAETSAIGRALAAFGLGGTEYATADEVANAIGQQNGSDAPATPPRASSSKAPSEKQIQLVQSLSKRLGYESSLVAQRIMLMETSAQASEAIEKLQAQLDKQGGE